MVTGLTFKVPDAPSVAPAHTSLPMFLTSCTTRFCGLEGSAAKAATKRPKGARAVVAPGSMSRQVNVLLLAQEPVLPEVAVSSGVVS